jgi:hypothetical protein
MSDDAIGWGDWGGEEQEAKLLPAGEYEGTITVATWAHADWAASKMPESGGHILKVKVEIDAPAGYAEAWTNIPRVKNRRWQFRQVCASAGVEGPSKDGPAWSPACLVGRRVRVATSIWTNERTGDSKVQIDKWFPAESWTQPDAGQPKAEPAKSVAKRTPTQKADAASGTIPNDDIPF